MKRNLVLLPALGLVLAAGGAAHAAPPAERSPRSSEEGLQRLLLPYVSPPEPSASSFDDFVDQLTGEDLYPAPALPGE